MPRKAKSTPAISLEKATYSPAYFVGRERELATITSRLEDNLWSGGAIAAPSVIHIWGLQGVGKTWFLKQLQEASRQIAPRTHKKRGVLCLWLDFEDSTLSNATGLQDAALADSLVRQAREQMQQAAEELPAPGNLPAAIEFLKGLTGDYALLLLCDTAEKLAHEDQLRLGSELIAPLIRTDQVIVVMAGRRELPRWRDLAVRQRLKSFELKPFDKATTREQFQKLNYPPELADIVYRLSFGHPYASQVIGASLNITYRSAQSAADFEQEHLDEVKVLLGKVEDELLKAAESADRKIIRCLAAVRRFNIESARKILRDLQSDALGRRSDGEFLLLFEDLQRTGLVWWSSEKHGYVVGEPLRRIIDLRIEKADPPDFQRRHKTALAFYSQAVERNPLDQPLYLLEILYHVARREVCAGAEELKQVIIQDFIEQYLDPAHLSADGADTFRHLLERDEELQNSRNILPYEIREDINTRISALINERDAQVKEEGAQG